MDLEATDAYLKRAKADAHRSKTRAANWVALILVLGLVMSLPVYVIALASLSADTASTNLDRIFLKWYDVVSPLVGAVIGALFGLTFSERDRADRV
jgi:ABC-type spermidine/putrescine transport system permease subunit II